MNINTGQIIDYRLIGDMIGPIVEVKRPLTVKEKADMQIRLYSPCGCGSGKKFKFCCKK